jgi:hypothetical protein
MLWKKQLPLLIAFLAGTIFFFQYFIPARVSEDSFQLYLDWVIVIGVFTAILGYYSIIRVHVVKMMKKTKDWYFSLVTLVCIVVMVTACYRWYGAIRRYLTTCITMCKTPLRQPSSACLHSTLHRLLTVPSVREKHRQQHFLLPPSSLCSEGFRLEHSLK